VQTQGMVIRVLVKQQADGNIDSMVKVNIADCLGLQNCCSISTQSRINFFFIFPFKTIASFLVALLPTYLLTQMDFANLPTVTQNVHRHEEAQQA